MSFLFTKQMLEKLFRRKEGFSRIPNEAPRHHQQATEKAIHLLGIFLEIHLIMSTCIQDLKGVFSPPYSHRMAKKGFKSYFMISTLISAIQLNYSFLDLIYLHHFTGLAQTVSLDNIAKLRHYSKI